MITEMHPIVAAMATGDAASLNAETRILFTRAGLAHLLCASGLHLIFAALLGGMVTRLGFTVMMRAGLPVSRRRQVQLESVVALVCSLHFCMVTGWRPPVTRATAALAGFLAFRCTGLHVSRLKLIFFSAIAGTLANGSLLSLGMSVAAVMGLLLAARLMQQRRSPLRWLLPVAAPWLATAPLCILFFHHCTLWSVPANLLLTPALSYTVLLPGLLGSQANDLGLHSAAAVLLSLANPSAGWWLALLEQHLPRQIGNFLVPVLPWLLLWAGGCLLILCRGRMRDWQKLLLWLVMAGFINSAKDWQQPAAELLAIGQGDALLLHNPAALLDAGPPGWGPYPAPVTGKLRARGISHLQDVIISHPDGDHIGGLFSLLRGTAIRRIWLAPVHLEFAVTQELLEAAVRRGILVRLLPVARPAVIRPGLACLVIPLQWRAARNDSSPVCRLQIKDKTVLLTGDMDRKMETQFLLWHPRWMQADWLKAGHHGSRFSSSEALLQHGGFTRALISAGAGNRYGHPHPFTLQRLQRHGIRVSSTMDGDIILP